MLLKAYLGLSVNSPNIARGVWALFVVSPPRASFVKLADWYAMGHSIFYPHPPYGRHDSDRPFAPNSVSDTSVYSKIRIRHPEFVIVHRFQRTNNCRTISSQSFRSVAQKRHQFWVRDWANLQICSLLTDKNRGKFPTARTRTNSRLYLRDAGSGISNTTAITRFNICSNHPSGGTPIWNRRGCSSEILDLNP